MCSSDTPGLAAALARRFQDGARDVPAGLVSNPVLAGIAARGSCRHFTPDPVPLAVLETLAAVALSAPSKSDLQQRDILIVDDPDLMAALKALLAAQAWIAAAPALVVFCANNQRQRLIHDWRGRHFANDHLDAFFNASVDAGIALATFVTAAESAGLGTCPISTIRNEATAVSDLLALPDHVFPVAGLAVGYPLHPSPRISMRLPLGQTIHRNRHSEAGLRKAVEAYDRARDAAQPYGQQRATEVFGTADYYPWSEEKTRQYALPERADFGAFIRRRGFNLD
ncbi:MAG: nitroreductase family protein [Pseudomonadota bacterium]